MVDEGVWRRYRSTQEITISSCRPGAASQTVLSKILERLMQAHNRISADGRMCLRGDTDASLPKEEGVASDGSYRDEPSQHNVREPVD